jgi:hypothetical protein
MHIIGLADVGGELPAQQFQFDAYTAVSGNAHVIILGTGF